MSEHWNATWEDVLLIEGQVSPAGRFAAVGAIKLPETPLPLTDLNGKIVGRVDRVWRDGNKIMGSGVCDSAITVSHFSSAVRVNRAEYQQVVTDGDIGSVAWVPPPDVRGT